MSQWLHLQNVYPKIGTTGKVDSRSSYFHLLVVAGCSGPAMLVHEKSGLEIVVMSDTQNNSALPAAATHLFDSILPPQGSYNEGYATPGNQRTHWKELLSTLGGKSSAELASYHDRAGKMRHENGATINPFDELTEQTTAWDLDMIPFPLSDQEWSGIEAGVKQRALLLEKILRDTYGPQELLKNNIIPPEFIFANPNFLHQCHGIQPSGDRYLTYYAVDIYRGLDGQFRVLRDYGSKLAGLGFALENRIVMSRLFPKLYHHSHIRRLAPFFRSFHQALTQRLGLGKDNPGILLLSPGPNNNLYFEHAMLSRYLGYPLVEGQDLTVRNGKVYMKKLTGLEPVEAIFRHISDWESDPFALRQPSLSGVAGLIQVCREQNIDIVNPIGSGFINTPALVCLLPKLCNYFAGEGLKLENHESWWCGSDEGRAKLEENIAGRTISTALSSDGERYADPQPDLLEKVKAAPFKYMLSEPVMPSYAPGWGDGGGVGSFCILRVFACATEKGFSVLPGGLAITSPDRHTLLCSPPEQQKSKDIWVISEEPVDPFSMMENFSAIPKFKRSSDLPNRVADNLLWLGRYLERAEGLIRLLRAVLDCVSGEERPEEVPELRFFLNILREKQIIPSSLEVETEDLDTELLQHLNQALYDKTRPESVLSILRNVQQTAHRVRDRMSTDSSRIINRLEGFRKQNTSDPLEQLDQTLFTLSAFSGLAMESMTRGLGWRFMDLGRRLERAMFIASLIRVSSTQLCEGSFYTQQALLRISDSLMTYRARYRSAFQIAPVLDLLLTDEGNPKSLAFQIARIADHVEYLPQEDSRRFANREERLVLEMFTAVRLLDLTSMQCGQNSDQLEELSQFLEKTEKQLTDFSQQVTAHYLSQVPATPHFSMISGNGTI